MSWKDYFDDLGFKEGVVVGCLLVVGVAAVLVLLGMRVDTVSKVKWWELMTAFGTVGAVIAAVAVPIHQNRDRLREQRYSELKSAFVVAQDVHQMCYKLWNLTWAFIEDNDPPSTFDMEYAGSQLGLAKQSTSDNFGRVIINDLLQQLTALRNVAPLSDLGMLSRIQKQEGVDGSPSADPRLEEIADRLDQLSGMSTRWVSDIVGGIRKLGRDLPLSVAQ